jgi:acetoin utilization deacetylase AcuC-like enzyme
MATGLVYHDDYLKHRQVQHHPECPDRLHLTMEHFLRTNFLDMLEQMAPKPATVEDLTRVHTREHVEYVRCLSERGSGMFSVIDSDTYVCKDTFEVARLAAGGVIEAGRAVWTGEVDNCFALVRPPGHHASLNQATGFCYFDNAAVMIKHLQANYGVRKVFIFDWDAHAPNGTMGTFYKDPSVLNMSIHQDPHSFYPGTGFIEQIGEGAGKGYTINFPVPGGTGDPDYVYFIEKFVAPRVRKFKPDIIVVAAGQDSHFSDRISQLNVTDAGFARMTEMMVELAREVCGGKIVLELEGGYNLATLPQTNYIIVSTLLGMRHSLKIEGEVMTSTKDILNKLEDTLKASTLWREAPEYGESGEVDKNPGKGACRIKPPL